MKAVREQTACHDPKVSVAMITYNHEGYIAQAIESVLMQQVSFAVELVIGEDCSTDRTRAIVNDYASRYPAIILAVQQPGNAGVSKNFADTLRGCRGKYIATLEGDDYWTDPGKLEKQVAFLQGNPECVICFHDAAIQTGGTSNGEAKTRAFYSKQPKSRASFADHAGGFVPPTCACLFVNDRLSLEPVLTGGLLCFATTVFYCLTRSGWLTGFMPERMAVYREHAGGIWSPLSPHEKLLMAIQVAEAVYLCFKSEQGAFFEPRLFLLYLRLSADQFRAGSIGPALKSYRTSLSYVFGSFGWSRVVLFSSARSTHLRCLRYLARYSVKRCYKLLTS